MNFETPNLLTVEFLPLSEAKAKLSEQVRKLAAGKKQIAITTNGRPTAILISYPEYLALLRQAKPAEMEKPTQVIDYEEWKQGSKDKEKVRNSILGLFEMDKLPRKGQKSYKQETVREFDPGTGQGTGKSR